MTTISATTFSVCIMRRFNDIMEPSPDRVRVISEATTLIQAIPIPTQRPVRIMGRAEGRRTRVTTNWREAPKLNAASI